MGFVSRSGPSGLRSLGIESGIGPPLWGSFLRGQPGDVKAAIPRSGLRDLRKGRSAQDFISSWSRCHARVAVAGTPPCGFMCAWGESIQTRSLLQLPRTVRVCSNTKAEGLPRLSVTPGGVISRSTGRGSRPARSSGSGEGVKSPARKFDSYPHHHLPSKYTGVESGGRRFESGLGSQRTLGLFRVLR